MKRQEWRRWLKLWRKIPYLSPCGNFASFDGLPNTTVDFQLKVSEDLLLEYNLDMLGVGGYTLLSWLMVFLSEVFALTLVWFLMNGWMSILVMTIQILSLTFDSVVSEQRSEPNGIVNT